MRLVTYTQRATPRTATLQPNDDLIDINNALAARLCDDGAQRPQLAADALNPTSMIDLLAIGQPALDAIEATRKWLDAGGLSREDAIANGSLIPAAHAHLTAPIPPARKSHGHRHQLPRPTPPKCSANSPTTPPSSPRSQAASLAPANPSTPPSKAKCSTGKGEFCVVIGRYARHVAAADALNYVAGYMNGNDVTIRDWQRHTATWMMGKGWDTHRPYRPLDPHRRRSPDPSALELKTYLNDIEKQSAPTSDLLFDIPTIIEYLSTAFTLEPGDVIFTGTPSGVGQAPRPPGMDETR